MKIDPKYFNLFAGTVAVFAFIAIIYFTISYSVTQKTDFVETIGEGIDLYESWFQVVDVQHATTDIAIGDSLHASMFRGKIVIVDFWSTWSDPAMESHIELWNIIKDHSDKIVVIAAGVRDADEAILEYASAHDYPFLYVQGTDIFQKFKVPGVPSQVIYMPSGTLVQVRVGYKGQKDYEVLRRSISAYQSMDISEFEIP